MFALLKAEEAEVIMEIEKHIGMELTIYINRDGTEMEPKGPFIIIENKHVFQFNSRKVRE